MSPAAPDPGKALRRLFLTLFLRGRSARGLDPDKAPPSIQRKLALALALYFFVGLAELTFLRQPPFGFSLVMHAGTFVLVGLFVASSSGEILFNQDESDILLHHPIPPAVLLKAKCRLLVEVSLWMAGAFTFAGLLGGTLVFPHGLGFLVGHLLGTLLMTLFTVGSVVLLYQVCLRRFGREKLEALMTTAQVMAGILAALAGQLPNILARDHGALPAGMQLSTAWMILAPPAWFAGLDSLCMGQITVGNLVLSALALGVTALVLHMAFVRLADSYEEGLQAIQERKSPLRAPATGTPWTDRLMDLPLIRLGFRDPVSRAGFRLAAAYMIRDRDVKLRLFPSLAPMLVVPIAIILKDTGSGSSAMGWVMMVAFLSFIPLVGQSVLQFSQHWQAADLFRVAPLEGPARLRDGVRRAVALLMTAPMLLAIVLAVAFLPGPPHRWMLLLPGAMTLPLVGRLAFHAPIAPLSMPIQEAKAANRIAIQLVGMFGGMIFAGLALLAHHFHLLGWFLVLEAAVVFPAWLALRHRQRRQAWTALG